MREVTDDALDALRVANERNGGPRLFQKGGALVRLRFDHDKPLVEIPNADALRGEMARCADWFRENRKKKELNAISPPKDVALDILHLTQWPFPRLELLAEAPFFDPGGNLFFENGYHPKAGIYLNSDLAIEPISAAPTASDVEQARALLLELIVNFPFADESSRAHALALLMQPFARFLIDGPTPAYAIDAPTPGTGKGLLSEVVAVVATGRPAEVIPEFRNEDELRKAITALLIGDPAIALFDNRKRRISEAAFLTALTGRVWKDRILGKSKMVSLPIRTAWILTGNNLRFDGEAARRVCWIRLDTKTEQPWTGRVFKHELPRWAHEQRSSLVWASLVLIQNWIASGRPRFAERTLGTFESWAEVMGGVLDAAGIRGFLENLLTFHDRADEDSAAWRAFVRGWWEVHAEGAVQAKELIALARETLPVEMLTDSENDHVQATRLGRALASRVDRVYEEWQIVRATVKGEKSQHRRAFALRRVLNEPCEPGEPCENASSPASPTSQGYSDIAAQVNATQEEAEINRLARADGWNSTAR
jgi:hypothetical protein